MGLDPVLIVGSLIVISVTQTGTFSGADLVLALIVFSLTFPGTLAPVRSGWQLGKEIIVGWTAVVLILVLLGYATDSLAVYDRNVLLSWLVAVPALLYAAHRVAPVLLPRILAMEGCRSAVIVGFTECGRKLAGEFAASKLLGVHVAGFFDDRAPGRLGPLPEAGLKGRLADLPAFVKTHAIESIFVALPMASQPRILSLLDELRDTTTSIYFVPDIFLADLIQARMDDINGVPIVAVCETPFYGVNGLVKRLEDLILGAVILTLSAPLMALIAVGVKLSSPGPMIFKQRRYGLDGKQIIVYKFRTMRVMEDGLHVSQVTRDDQRVTRFGALLRRTSLDELPQFFNVIQGRMSIVGPRPHAIAHNELYRKLIKGYMVRHKVKPGITGLAQVSGFRGETDSLEKMQARINSDLHYLRNWSLRLDLAIILKTIILVLRVDRHAY